MNLDSDAKLKVNVNRFENDNVWNVENRHRIVVPKQAVPSALMGGSFIFNALFPSSDHTAELLDFFGYFDIFFGINFFRIPSQLEEKLHQIYFLDCR